MVAGPSTSQAHSEPLWFKGKTGNWEAGTAELPGLFKRLNSSPGMGRGEKKEK